MKLSREHKKIITLIAKEIFQVFFIAYLVFLFIDIFDPGFISNFLNLNYLLIFVVINGMIAVILAEPLPEKKAMKKRDRALLAAFLTVITFIIFWHLPAGLGGWTWLLSACGALVVGVVGWVLMSEYTNDDTMRTNGH